MITYASTISIYDNISPSPSPKDRLCRMAKRPAAHGWHDQLKRARVERTLPQRELARRVGLPQSHISKIENGHVDPGLSTAIELARALGLEPVLVPRGRLAAVEAVLRPNTEGRQRSAVEALTGIPGDDPP